MGELRVGNVIIPYEERYSAKAKKLRITVDRDKVTVTLPKTANIEEARKFVEAKSDWVYKHVQEYRDYILKEEGLKQKQYVEGEGFLYLGKELTLRTIVHNAKGTVIKLEKDTIWIYIPATAPKEAWPKVVKEALRYTYKMQAKKIFKDKLDHYSHIMGVTYNDFRIKEQKTRWGSCSSKGNINFNWRAIMAPSHVIDYLTVHELAHLKILNHSKDFWRLVAKFMPDYKASEKWLKENAKKLVI